MKTESYAKLTLLQILPKEGGEKMEKGSEKKLRENLKRQKTRGNKQRSNFFSEIYSLKGMEKIHETDFYVSKSSGGAWPI